MVVRQKVASRGTPDMGAQFIEYAALILLCAVLVGTLMTVGIGERIERLISAGVCRIVGENCQNPENGGPDADGKESQGNGKNNSGLERDNNKSDSGRGESPSGKELEEVEDEVEEVRDWLDEDWYNPLDWFGGPDHPKDIMDGMSADEIRALYWSLNKDEIKQLLQDDDVRNLTLKNADEDTIDRLRGIAPDAVEPEFGNVEAKKDAKKEKNTDFDPQWGEVDNGKLYGENNNISSDDLSQGRLGNCWWLAGMGAIADQNPQAIKKMITDNGNGTYTVTFGDGEKVTVSDDIVVDEYGNPLFSDPESDGVMWPAILEKAYAEREGSFADTEGGHADEAMEMITGGDSEEHDPDEVTEKQLNEWLDGDTAVSVSTMPEGEGKGELYDNDELHESHAYIVKAVSDGEVELYNPWGTDHVTMSMEEFDKYLREVDTISAGE